MDQPEIARTPSHGETEWQKKARNNYFVRIARLETQRDVFESLEALRYNFAAYFGEDATLPFDVIAGVCVEIKLSAALLIQATGKSGEDTAAMPEQRQLVRLGIAPRPDEIDQRVRKAVADGEATCRPVLAAAAALGA